MKSGKTKYYWCPKVYTSHIAYSTHLNKVLPDKNLKSTETQKEQLFNISNLSISRLELDPDINKAVSSDIEYESERYDKKTRGFSSNPEHDGVG